VSVVGYDYGNARLAARRARLPDRARLRRLGQAAGTGELLALLAQEPDWRRLRRPPGAIGGDARTAAEDLVERWRAAAEGELLRWYAPPALPLVEALVMPLDAERVLEVLRLRRAGLPPDEAERRLAPGAVLDEDALGRLLRAPSERELFATLAAAGLVAPGAAGALAELRPGFPDPEARAAAAEAAVMAAVADARADRARGRGADAAEVRAILVAEAADRAAVAAALAADGPAPAAVLERTLALERWAALGRRAHRDPLGIIPVAAFVAAVERTVVRLRAVIARVGGAWREEQAAEYLAAGPAG
jgi:hypothetical protein